MEQEIYKGTIVNFKGSWGSGIGYLGIRDDKTGQTSSIPCENTSTVRGLENCFGGVITEGHCANGSGYVGKTIYWGWDDMGLLMGWFYPEEAEYLEEENTSYELEEKYQAQFKGRKKNKKVKK